MSIWVWTELMLLTMKYRYAARLLTLILAALTITSCGITAPRSNDGYANLDSPGMSETDRTMSLSLGRTTLRFAARFMNDEPETQALLRSLDGVRIRMYEVHGDNEKIAENFERMGQKLSSDGWSPVILIHEEGELVQMYAKPSGDRIQGLTIVSSDGDEVVVVNVMGDLDPKYYTDVMVALDVDGVPDVQIASAD
jgi:hypothetical protein